MYNEETYCAAIVEHCCRLDWPRDRLTIQVLDDSSNKVVRDKVDACVSTLITVVFLCMACVAPVVTVLCDNNVSGAALFQGAAAFELVCIVAYAAMPSYACVDVATAQGL